MIQRRYRALSFAALAGILVAFTGLGAEARAADGDWRRLDAARFAKMNSFEKFLALLFKYDRKRLDDRNMFIYWTAMNDCKAAVKHNDEFAWDDIETYYKTKLGATLDDLDGYYHVAMNIDLGKYDRQAKKFPITYDIDAAEITGMVLSDGQSTFLCNGYIPRIDYPAMRIEFLSALPTTLSVDEAAARGYVDSRPTPEDRRALEHLLLRITGARIETVENIYDRKKQERIVFAATTEYAVVTADYPRGFGPRQSSELGVIAPPKSPDLAPRLENLEFNWATAFTTRSPSGRLRTVASPN